jgi:HD-GYP domain-containing protein (c-di-GMP phosphodiesterase class II)
VLLLDAEKRELYSLFAQGLDVSELRFSVTTGLAGFAVRAGVTLNVPDAYRDARFNAAFDKASGYRTISALCLPLRNRRGEPLGVIQCLNKQDGAGGVTAFNREDEAILSAVAGQAAVFLENSALNRQMDLLFEAFVEAMSRAIDDRDPCTSGHSRRVTQYALNLARAVHASQTPPFDQVTYTRERLRRLRYACLLHDVGKIGVREYILCKMAKLAPPQLEVIRQRFTALKAIDSAAALGRELDQALALIERVNTAGLLAAADLEALRSLHARRWVDDAEFENLAVPQGNLTAAELVDMQSHVQRTWRMLTEIPWPPELADLADIAYEHHERLNGAGYPRHLKGEALHLDGQIIAVADIYDALTAADRPYKRALPHDKAREILLDEAAQGRLQTALVQLFFDQGCGELHADAARSAPQRA